MKKAKMTKKGWIITLIIAVIIAVIIWFIVRSKKEDGNETGNENENKNSTFPLQYGSTGENVEALQSWLISQGQTLPKYGVDGIFQSETLAALVAATGKETMSETEFNEILNS